MENLKENSVLVCIPSYNAEESIATTIESALNQSIKNFKILIIDNCSTDKTAEIVEEIHRINGNHEKIEFVTNSSNIGRIPNWNKCIELFLDSGFSYLKFLFTGDIIEKDCLKILLGGFQKFPEKPGIVVAGYNAVDNGSIIKTQIFNTEEYLSPRDGLALFVKNGNWVGAPISCMFSKDAIRYVRFNESFDFTSDYVFYIEVVSNYGALRVNEIIGNFSISQRNHFKKYRNSFFANIEELHAMYFALNKLSKYLSKKEKDSLTGGLNRESVKALILRTSLLDSFGIFVHKIKMSFLSRL